jgi:large subunit ribosomal protein L23
MAILDIFKNKEEEEKAALKAKKPVKKAVKKVSVEKTDAVSSEVKAVTPVKNTVRNNDGKFSYEAMKQPHISEKATYLADSNKYTFEVSPNYNKHEIKSAVEGVYGVKVLSVNIIKIPAKKRRLGKTQGFRKAFKKAIVTIKEGQKIEIL